MRALAAALLALALGLPTVSAGGPFLGASLDARTSMSAEGALPLTGAAEVEADADAGATGVDGVPDPVALLCASPVRDVPEALDLCPDAAVGQADPANATEEDANATHEHDHDHENHTAPEDREAHEEIRAGAEAFVEVARDAAEETKDDPSQAPTQAERVLAACLGFVARAKAALLGGAERATGGVVGAKEGLVAEVTALVVELKVKVEAAVEVTADVGLDAKAGLGAVGEGTADGAASAGGAVAAALDTVRDAASAVAEAAASAVSEAKAGLASVVQSFGSGGSGGGVRAKARGAVDGLGGAAGGGLDLGATIDGLL